MNFFIEFFRNILLRMFQLLWFSKHKISNNLSIFIKTYNGKTLAVDLNPKWDIKNVKEIVAQQMGMSPDDLKIIFAGKELENSTLLEECDLGQQSILHAVKIPTRRRKLLRNSTQVIPEFSDDTHNSKDKSLNGNEENQITLHSSKIGQLAHFFVYCSMSCKSIEVGKLRVKCGLCNSGAVTVDRDPQSWSDVLEPNRITIHCENEKCQLDRCASHNEFQCVLYARFYFKCANHTSRGESDEVIPLYLIKSNLRKIPCLACTEIRENVLVFPCEAAHVSCLECFKEYCTIRLSERQFEFDPSSGFYTLACPIGCTNSFIKEIHHFKILPPNEYERYQRFSAEEYVLRAGGILCPQPDCGMGIILPDNGKTECRKIHCLGGCDYVFCRNCLQGYHLGDCDIQQLTVSSVQYHTGEYTIDPKKAEDAKWDDASTKIIKKSTKPCPKCRTPTERDGGCMHMVCTRAGCAFQWCWVCQTSWTRECMGNHWFG